MVAMKTTDDERKLVDEAARVFADYAAIGPEIVVDSFPTLRRLQIEHCRWQSTKLDPKADCSIAVLSLGIVEEACWELPMAIEAENRDETFDALGDVLVFTCGVSTGLRLDFLTLAKDFHPDGIVQPDGIDGIMNLYKAIGMLAHVMVHHRQGRRGYDDIGKVRQDAGAAIAKICSAIHWLAFSNDWDATYLFHEVITTMMAKRDWAKHSANGEAPLLQLEDPPINVDTDSRD